jgi:hypothetical protein
VQEQLVSALKKLSPSERTQLATVLKRVLTDAGISKVRPELFLEAKGKDREH